MSTPEPPGTEYVNDTYPGILLQVVLHLGDERVDAAPKIYRLGVDQHLRITAKSDHRALCSALITEATSAGLAPCAIMTDTPRTSIAICTSASGSNRPSAASGINIVATAGVGSTTAGETSARLRRHPPRPSTPRTRNSIDIAAQTPAYADMMQRDLERMLTFFRYCYPLDRKGRAYALAIRLTEGARRWFAHGPNANLLRRSRDLRFGTAATG